MKLHYTAFTFNKKVYGSLFNVVMSDDFYAESIRGSRSILEDKIPGRDIPYFYEVEDDVLEFDVNFAFENPMTKSEISNIAKDLLSPTSYREMTFGDYYGISPLVAAYTSTTSNVITNNAEKIFAFNTNPAGGFIVGSRIRAYNTSTPTNFMEGVITFISGTDVTIEVDLIGGTGTITSWSFHLVYAIKTPFYKVIFTGEPKIEYIGVNSAAPKFLAYFNLKVRCDRPYGFYKVRQTLSSGTSITINNTGDLNVYPGITFTAPSTTTNYARLYNSTNLNAISFTNFLVETIAINSNLKTISTSNAAGIYNRWMRDDLILYPGNNVINFQQSASSSFTSSSAVTLTTITVTFEAPAFIKGE